LASFVTICQEKFEDIKGVIKKNPNKSKDNTIQWPNEKGQTMIYKTLCRKLKIEIYEHHKKNLGVNSGGPQGYAVLAPLVAPVKIFKYCYP